MIITKLQQHLLKIYAQKHLGRNLTNDEIKRIFIYNGHRLEFIRNKYYRDINKIIEEAVKEIKKNEDISN